MAVVGIVPAGGAGERLGAGTPKAFVLLAGRPLVEWSVRALSAACERVVVALPSFGEGADGDAAAVPGADCVIGGASRSASVRAALAAAPEATVAVVHDAARPLATPELVRSCLDALEGFDGAVAGAPVSDTVKEADPRGRVLRTLERSSLWAIQTPQAFRADALRRALETDEATLRSATDDAALVEARGGSVCVVEAPSENLKVTREVDLALAEALLGARERASDTC